MSTAVGIWLFAVALSVPLVWAAFRVTGKLGAAVTIFIGGIMTFILGLAAVQEAFFEGEFSIAIHQEMGRKWVAHRITSGGLPFLLTSLILGIRKPWK